MSEKEDRARILREYAETWRSEPETGYGEFRNSIADALAGKDTLVPINLVPDFASITGGIVTAENCAAFNDSEDVVEVNLSVYVAPDAPALFGVSDRNIVDLNAPAVRAVIRRNNIRWNRAVRRLRPICEIEHRAATSRYWAQRLRWLRKRGRA